MSFDKYSSLLFGENVEPTAFKKSSIQIIKSLIESSPQKFFEFLQHQSIRTNLSIYQFHILCVLLNYAITESYKVSDFRSIAAFYAIGSCLGNHESILCKQFLSKNPVWISDRFWVETILHSLSIDICRWKVLRYLGTTRKSTWNSVSLHNMNSSEVLSIIVLSRLQAFAISMRTLGVAMDKICEIIGLICSKLELTRSGLNWKVFPSRLFLTSTLDSVIAASLLQEELYVLNRSREGGLDNREGLGYSPLIETLLGVETVLAIRQCTNEHAARHSRTNSPKHSYCLCGHSLSPWSLVGDWPNCSVPADVTASPDRREKITHSMCEKCYRLLLANPLNADMDMTYCASICPIYATPEATSTGHPPENDFASVYSVHDAILFTDSTVALGSSPKVHVSTLQEFGATVLSVVPSCSLNECGLPSSLLAEYQKVQATLEAQSVHRLSGASNTSAGSSGKSSDTLSELPTPGANIPAPLPSPGHQVDLGKFIVEFWKGLTVNIVYAGSPNIEKTRVVYFRSSDNRCNDEIDGIVNNNATLNTKTKNLILDTVAKSPLYFCWARRSDKGSLQYSEDKSIDVDTIKTVKVGSNKWKQCINISGETKTMVIKIVDEEVFQRVLNGLLSVVSFRGRELLELTMLVDRLFELPIEELRGLAQKLSLEDALDDTLEIEDLQGILFSYVSSYPNFDQAFELSETFNESFELVHSLLESNSNILDRNLLDQFPASKFVEVRVSRYTGLVLAANKSIIGRKILVYEDTDGSNVNIVPWSGHEVKNATVSSVESCVVKIANGIKQGIHVIELPFGVNTSSIHLSRRLEVNGATINENLVVTPTIFVTSAVYEYTSALDEMIDCIVWSWEGEKGGLTGSPWTEELENSLYELLVAVSDDLVAVVRSMSTMMSFMNSLSSQSASDEMEKMLSTIQNDVRLALCDHNSYSIGRLHQTLIQFVEMSSSGMMNLPYPFVSAVNNFVQAKMKASSAGNDTLQINLMKMVIFGKLYRDGLPHSSSSERTKLDKFLGVFSVHLHLITSSFPSEDLTSALTMTGSELTTHLRAHCLISSQSESVSSQLLSAPLSYDQINAVMDLKPKSLEVIAFQSSATNWQSDRISYMGTIPLSYIENPLLLSMLAMQQSQTLFGEVMNLDNMMGFNIALPAGAGVPGNLPLCCAIITRLIDAGLTYVTTEGGKVVALFPTKRSVLRLYSTAPASTNVSVASASDAAEKTHKKHQSKKSNAKLNDPNAPIENPITLGLLPMQLRKRLNDMPRIFRMKVHQKLSLRLNSNLSLAVEKLREHHGDDCWVGPQLEAVWRLMAATSPPRLMVFELWYGDEMIAADFGHPTSNGRAIYIATRFFNRANPEIKLLMPGFLLALAECRVLHSWGCRLWDLGGVNLCPLMRYKLDLTGQPMERPEAYHEHVKATSESSAGGSGREGSSLLNATAGVLVDDVKLSDLLGY